MLIRKAKVYVFPPPNTKQIDFLFIKDYICISSPGIQIPNSSYKELHIVHNINNFKCF